MNLSALKRRLLAAGAHLAISAAVLLAPLFMIFYSWFPRPYFDSDGGFQAAIILSFVHFILGPVLTFVVISPNKSMGKIKFDIVVIATLQIAALTFGTFVVHDQRPVAVVFAKDKFLPVSANIIHQQGASAADLRAFGARSPVLVFSRPPSDREEFAQMMLLALNEGVDIMAQIKTFQPFADHLPEAAQAQPDLRQLELRNPAFAAELESFLRAHDARREDFVYFPFNGRYKRILLVVDERGRLVGAISSAFRS